MAEQGGPNQIGAVNVGIGADISALKEALGQAKQEAQKQGEETGKAFVEGVEKGKANSGYYVGSVPSVNGIVGPGIAPASPSPASPSSAPSSSTGGGFGAATAFNTSVGAAMQIAAQIDKFEAIGEKIGNALFGGVKQMAEVAQAIERSAASFARQMQMERQAWDNRTGGNKQIDSAAIARLQKYESQEEKLQEEIAGANNMQQFVGDFGRRLERRMGIPNGWTFLGQKQKQLAELQSEIQSARRQVSGIATGHAAVGTTLGGVETEMAGEMGIPISGRLQPQQSLSISGAEEYRMLFRSDPELLRMMVRLQSGTVAEQQKARIELIKGVTPGVR